MLGRARAPRDLPVADVAHQRMPERVLVLAVDRRGRTRAHQFLLAMLVQQPVRRPPRPCRPSPPPPPPRRPRRRPTRRAAAPSRSAAARPAAPRSARARSRGPGCSRRAGPAGRRATTWGSNSIRTNSSAYSGLPPAVRDDRRPRVGRQRRVLQQRRQQLPGVLLGQRRERDRHGVPLPAAPSGRRSSSSGRAAQTISSGTGPAQSTRCSMKSSSASSAQLQVLEEQHQRAVHRQGLEEAPPGGEQLVLVVGRLGVLPDQPDERREPAADPVHLRPVERERVERGAQLPRRPRRAGPSPGCRRARGRSRTAPRTSSPRRTAGTVPGAT